MRFLADENIPGDAVAEIEAAGHDIVWVRTVAPGSKDEDILALAEREERIILILPSTRILVNSPGVQDCRRHRATIRLPMPRAAEGGTILATRIHERTDWAGHFTVSEPGRVRMRPLAKQ